MAMTVRARLEKRVDDLNEAIFDMEEHNDGSLRWVDDLHELYCELTRAEAALAECGGYREANVRKPETMSQFLGRKLLPRR